MLYQVNMEGPEAMVAWGSLSQRTVESIHPQLWFPGLVVGSEIMRASPELSLPAGTLISKPHFLSLRSCLQVDVSGLDSYP